VGVAEGVGTMRVAERVGVTAGASSVARHP
jgi:hypothetical protein